MIDPISLGFIAGAVFGVVAGVVTAIYWENIREWIKEVYENLPIKIKETLVSATSFAKRFGLSFQNIMKYYSYDKELNKWEMTVVTQEVDESTIPESIRKKLDYSSEVETTDDLQRELKLNLS